MGVTVDRTVLRFSIAAAIGCLQLAALVYVERPVTANLVATACYGVWALLALFPPMMGSLAFRTPEWLNRIVETFLCGAMIATGGPMLVAILALSIPLFMPSDFLAHISRWSAARSLLAASIVSAALVLAHRLPILSAGMAVNPLDAVMAAMMFSMFAAAFMGGSSRAETQTEADELSHHVAFASKAPIERLAELVAERMHARVVLVFSASPEHPISGQIASGSGRSPLDMDEDVAAQLHQPEDETQAFLLDSRAGHLLSADQFGRVGSRKAPQLATVWNGLFGPARVAAIPVAMGRANGWLYMATDSHLSHRGFLELRNQAARIGAMVMRFERFESWRQRTLAEARLLASRDMHDSVLQTLAGLRMQLSSMVKMTAESGMDALNARMQSLDEIVAAEQRHLREILERSKEDAETAAELFSYLQARAHSLARQWNLRCTVEIPEETLPTSEETAIECEFLLREAIANAAKHAEAQQINVKFGLRDDTLLIVLRAESLRGGEASGPAGRKSSLESRSLNQRVNNLGGSAYLETVRGGGIVSIQIPLERK